MKATHRPDIWTWSVFDQARNLDFNGYAIVREGGNVLVDPVPMSEHDRAHLESLGGAALIVVTNSDHVRDAHGLAAHFGARVEGPASEDLGSLDEGGEAVPGLYVHSLRGSKTPGELALRYGDTVFFGDLVRAHVGGALNLLPEGKLTDRAAALASVREIARRGGIRAVLVGDGWPVFRDGQLRLAELLA